jgi:DNA topoisomerase VI subunit B
MTAAAAKLARRTFTTSRLLEFCSQKELTLQTGHPVEQWPLVIEKEVFDNALDNAEESGVPPQIKVVVDTNPESASITISDNGGGIPASTVEKLLDFRVRVSSREAYASPTRGAQGNALKTIIAIPFVLDGTKGETVIDARAIRHRITFLVDAIRQEPKIEHHTESSKVKNGTSISIRWPGSACSQLECCKPRFLQIAEDYTWLNPHLSAEIIWNGKRQNIKATDAVWAKWGPSEPTSPHWYDTERLQRLAAAYVADDQDNNSSRTVREFISEFRGLSGSAKQKQVLDTSSTSRMALPDLFKGGEANHTTIAKLLRAMKDATKPVRPQSLGVIGKDALAAKFTAAGADLKTFSYVRRLRDDDGVPAVIEVAFGYCPKGPLIRRIITGVNWSVGINNPFRQLGRYGESLDTYLQEQRAGRTEPIIMVVHLASPRIAYTDRGKSAVALHGEMSAGKSISDDITEALRTVTKVWTKQRKREERRASAEAIRYDRLVRARRETIKGVAYEIMEAAYLKASNNGTLPATARQVMYAARDEIQQRTEKKLDDDYFTQTLLPDYIEDSGVEWNIVFDDRGHFREPHTKHTIGLGTLNVRRYESRIGKIGFHEPSLAPGVVSTCGPIGCYGAILFIEKEGFMPLLEAVNLAERFDIAIMSTKGVSVTAARRLIDQVCGNHDIPLLILHDFDKAGFSIAGTLQRDTRRYTFEHRRIKVIDLGLRIGDITDLQSEKTFDKGSRASRAINLADNGATEAEIDFLLDRRVELNAMTADQLVAFLERKLRRHGIKKIVPGKKQLAEAYELFGRSRHVEGIVEQELKRTANGHFKQKIPHDLDKQVRQFLMKHPETRWDAVVRAIERKAEQVKKVRMRG